MIDKNGQNYQVKYVVHVNFKNNILECKKEI